MLIKNKWIFQWFEILIYKIKLINKFITLKEQIKGHGLWSTIWNEWKFNIKFLA